MRGRHGGLGIAASCGCGGAPNDIVGEAVCPSDHPERGARGMTFGEVETLRGASSGLMSITRHSTKCSSPGMWTATRSRRNFARMLKVRDCRRRSLGDSNAGGIVQNRGVPKAPLPHPASSALSMPPRCVQAGTCRQGRRQMAVRISILSAEGR